MNSESLEKLCECTVCFKLCEDPRLLKCGHPFCDNCLKNVDKHAPRGDIPCPVCHNVPTPKPLLHGDIATFQQYTQEEHTEEPLGQKCTKCKVTRPTIHCYECTAELAYLCDTCFEVHQKIKRFEKHNTTKFDPNLICPEHSHKMVENFCYDCNAMVCMDCMFDKHADHNTEHIEVAAQKARQVLRKFITKLDGKSINKTIISDLKQASVNLEDIKKKFNSNVESIKMAWKTLDAKRIKAVEKMMSTSEKELQSISNNQAKIAEISAGQEKMLKLAEGLLGDVSDPQVIIGSRDLPEPDIDITEVQVNLPVIPEQFDKMAADLETMTKSMDISYNKDIYKIKRGKKATQWNLRQLADITGACEPLGLSFADSAKPQLLVRVNDGINPIRVYNTNGSLNMLMGIDTQGMIGAYRQVAVDTSRSLYLLPGNNGLLIRMGTDGVVRDTTKLGADLCGVAYIPEIDLYALSDITINNVFLVSPANLTVIWSIEKGSFHFPNNVCVGDINGSTTIVVSDCGTNTLYLYSVSGELIKTYGPETHTLGRLSGIWEVSVDKTGGIVVCDKDNFRVLRVWSDKDGDHWECLLDKEQLPENPYCLDINIDNSLMAVSFGHTVRLYTIK